MSHGSFFFLKNYCGYALLLLFSHFLLLFGSGYLLFGSFQMTLGNASNEDALPLADVVVKLEGTQDDKVSSLTHALPAGNHSSKKAKVSHICEAVDRDKYIEPLRPKIHI